MLSSLASCCFWSVVAALLCLFRIRWRCHHRLTTQITIDLRLGLVLAAWKGTQGVLLSCEVIMKFLCLIIYFFNPIIWEDDARHLHSVGSESVSAHSSECEWSMIKHGLEPQMVQHQNSQLHPGHTAILPWDRGPEALWAPLVLSLFRLCVLLASVCPYDR